MILTPEQRAQYLANLYECKYFVFTRSNGTAAISAVKPITPHFKMFFPTKPNQLS